MIKHQLNMKTIIKVNENYQIVKRKVDNEKGLPISLMDLIIPILTSKYEQKEVSTA